MLVGSLPKFSKEMEEKIIALFEQDKKNSVISRELNIHRDSLPARRKKWEKRKKAQEKPETEPEETDQRKKNESQPLESTIYTLMRYQGTNSREEALSQAIETQHALNPYILNHGLKTPADLIAYFKDKIKDGEESVALHEKLDDLTEIHDELREDHDFLVENYMALAKIVYGDHGTRVRWIDENPI